MSGKNVAHSVRTRLLDRSRKSGEDYQLLLNRYAIERLLYRLARSDHGKAFVLKGAMLFALWTGEMHRPTRDLDLLGFGDPSQERLRDVFRSLCAVPVDDDGLIFDADSVTIEPIREDQEYGGQRAKFIVRLGQAKISLQVDVGFGDAITPAAEEVEYPTLLGMDPPRLRAYPKETVVAEKVEAMVKLGLANSRMKDFYDVLVMSRTFEFDGDKLRSAIKATFERRQTPIPRDTPVALTQAFATDVTKVKQWAAFRTRIGVVKDIGELSEVLKELAVFLLVPLHASTVASWNASWDASRRWSE